MTTESHRLIRERTLRFLKLLTSCKPNQRRDLLKAAPKKVVHLLSELSLNLIKGKFKPTSHRKLKILRRFQLPIKRIAEARNGIKGTRKLLIQQGNGPLVPVLITAASALLPSVIDGIIKLVKSKNEQQQHQEQ